MTDKYIFVALVAFGFGMALGSKSGEVAADKATYMNCSKYGQAELVDKNWLITCAPKKEPQ